MTVKMRIMTLSLLGKLERSPECAQRLGVQVVLRPKSREERKEQHV